METTKFNKSEILKKSWSLVKTKGYTLRNAMRVAWAYARNGQSVYKGDAERIFNSPVSRFQGDKLAALQDSINRGL